MASVTWSLEIISHQIFFWETKAVRPLSAENQLEDRKGSSISRLKYPKFADKQFINFEHMWTSYMESPLGNFFGDFLTLSQQIFQKDIDECSSLSVGQCENGGECRNEIGSFGCNCLDGFKG